MTLVIAGLSDDRTAFFCADSTISANGRTLLSGFRKIYPVTVTVWRPSFNGEYFHGYKEEYESSSCVIAFSGNTLTAQHLLNSISSHLSSLRISWSSKERAYVLLRHCDRSNELFRKGMAWSEEMFLTADFRDLLTCQAIFAVILYSVNEALASARKYKFDPQGFASLRTAFLAAAHEPASGVTRIAQYDFDEVTDVEGLLRPIFRMSVLERDDIALIGEKSIVAHKPVLRRRIDSSGESAAKVSFEFLCEKISESLAKGAAVVDYPAVLKQFCRGELSTIQKIPQRPRECHENWS